MKEISCKLLVIGAGPGGYVCAIRAGQLGIDTVIVEAGKPGGTCLNVGCIPSKALIHAAEEFEKVSHMAGGKSPLGISVAAPALDLARTVAWKDGIVSRLNSGVAGLLKKAKVKTVQGWAKFRDGKTVEVETETGVQVIRAETVVIATGSAPVELPFLPFGGPVISSTEALALSEVPKKLAVVGGGYIGLELGIAFAKMGAKVTVVEALPRVLAQYDAELTRPVAKRLAELGIEVMLGAKAKGLSTKGDALLVETCGRQERQGRRRQDPGHGRAQAGDRRLGARADRPRHGRKIHPHRRPVPHLDARHLRHRRRHRRADAGAPGDGARRNGRRDRRRPQAQLGQALHSRRLLHRSGTGHRRACRRKRQRRLAARSRSACSPSPPTAAR